MFGELIGLWLAVAWQAAGSPSPVVLAELGPGRGTLMADALRAAAKVPGFVAAARIHLVETSPVLREAQEKALAAADLPHAPQWHDGPESLPEGPLLLVANEFFDALPIRQFEYSAQGWHERRIAIGNDDELIVTLSPAGPAPPFLPQIPEAASPGSVAEICPAAIGLMAILARRIREDGIAALVIDYGHTESGYGDTLQAVKDHAFANVLVEPGKADLTAHVDFAALDRVAREEGAEVHGPVTQAMFLNSLGIAARADALAHTNNGQHAEDLRAAVERLTGANGMGTLFKVMAVTSPHTAVI
jgi:NADH dehydrogenase [ubiquinone] 1 alpha subcomplex assembly factor 7